MGRGYCHNCGMVAPGWEKRIRCLFDKLHTHGMSCTLVAGGAIIYVPLSRWCVLQRRVKSIGSPAQRITEIQGSGIERPGAGTYGTHTYYYTQECMRNDEEEIKKYMALDR